MLRILLGAGSFDAKTSRCIVKLKAGAIQMLLILISMLGSCRNLYGTVYLSKKVNFMINDRNEGKHDQAKVA